jgi:hypothetical protein
MTLLASFANLAGPDLVVLALIMLMCGLPYVIFAGFIAARKGQSVPLFCLLCFIPIVNLVASIWLASLPDAAVIARLNELERRTPPAI